LIDSTKIKSLEAHESWVTCLKKTDDSTKLISSSLDKTIKIWNLETFDLIKTLKGHEASVFEFDLISNDQKIISCSRDKSLRIWQISSGECLNNLKFDDPIFSLKSITDDLVAIGLRSSESNLVIYSLDKKKIVKKLIGHTDFVIRVELLSDNNQLVSCSNDKTVKLWQL
jgi:WD40 repeat protein